MNIEWVSVGTVPSKSGYVFIVSTSDIVRVCWFEAHVDQFWSAGMVFDRDLIKCWAILELPEAPAEVASSKTERTTEVTDAK